MSTADKALLNPIWQTRIQWATDAYNAAAAKGDKAGMDQAHRRAEAIRASAGYSGGSDGSKFVPKPSSSSSGSTAAASSSASSAAKSGSGKSGSGISSPSGGASKSSVALSNEDYLYFAKELGLATASSPYKDILDTMFGNGGFTLFTGVSLGNGSAIMDYNQQTGVRTWLLFTMVGDQE